MKNAISYLRDRLNEPGTLRSLVVVIIGIQQGADAAGMVDAIVALLLVALGAFSALKPEPPK
jgi:hypothetical protein